MKTSEMIAMLEKNPELKFESKKGSSYSTNLTASSSLGTIDIMRDGIREWVSVGIDRDWQLVREPVPVWEAIKALCEGKLIWVEMPDGTSERFPCNPYSDWCRKIGYKQITQGKWFIEEDNSCL